jgi:hypothetical protein
MIRVACYQASKWDWFSLNSGKVRDWSKIPADVPVVIFYYRKMERDERNRPVVWVASSEVDLKTQHAEVAAFLGEQALATPSLSRGQGIGGHVAGFSTRSRVWVRSLQSFSVRLLGGRLESQDASFYLRDRRLVIVGVDPATVLEYPDWDRLTEDCRSLPTANVLAFVFLWMWRKTFRVGTQAEMLEEQLQRAGATTHDDSGTGLFGTTDYRWVLWLHAGIAAAISSYRATLEKLMDQRAFGGTVEPEISRELQVVADAERRIEQVRSRLAEYRGLLLGAQSSRDSVISLALSIVSAFFLPLVVVTSFWGMGFPFFDAAGAAVQPGSTPPPAVFPGADPIRVMWWSVAVSMVVAICLSSLVFRAWSSASRKIRDLRP